MNGRYSALQGNRSILANRSTTFARLVWRSCPRLHVLHSSEFRDPIYPTSRITSSTRVRYPNSPGSNQARPYHADDIVGMTWTSLTTAGAMGVADAVRGGQQQVTQAGVHGTRMSGACRTAWAWHGGGSSPQRLCDSDGRV